MIARKKRCLSPSLVIYSITLVEKLQSEYISSQCNIKREPTFICSGVAMVLTVKELQKRRRARGRRAWRKPVMVSKQVNSYQKKLCSRLAGMGNRLCVK